MHLLSQDAMQELFAVTDELGLDRESITVPLEMTGDGAVRQLSDGKWEITLPDPAQRDAFFRTLPQLLQPGQ